jgi:hypothetical protein
MGAASQEGQADDVTGNDAGAEEAFGHGPEPADRAAEGSRPSTTGRTGPH